MEKFIILLVLLTIFSINSKASVSFSGGIDDFFVEGEDTRKEFQLLLSKNMPELISNFDLIEDRSQRNLEAEAIGAQDYDYHYQLAFYLKSFKGEDSRKYLKLKLTDMSDYHCDQKECSNYRLVLEDYRILEKE